MNTCQLPDCASPCHSPVVGAGRYCAPFRCYCGGCAGYVALPPRGEPWVAPLIACTSCDHLVLEVTRAGLCEDCEAVRRRELTTAPPLSPPAGARAMDRAELDRIRLRHSEATALSLGS